VESSRLDDVTTQELVEELDKRSEAIVLAFFPKANPDQRVQYYRSGRRFECLGMATALQREISDTIAADDTDDTIGFCT